MDNLCSSLLKKRLTVMLKNKRGLTVLMTGPLYKCVRNVMLNYLLAIGWLTVM
jgi:hypothetical protein